VVVDEGGWVLQLEGDSGVRRRQSIEGKEQLRGVLTRGGGRSPARRRGFGSRKLARRTPGRWTGETNGARAWTGETNGARGRRIRPAGGGAPISKRAGGGRNRRGVG
jgi:hypothetical protein